MTSHSGQLGHIPDLDLNQQQQHPMNDQDLDFKSFGPSIQNWISYYPDADDIEQSWSSLPKDMTVLKVTIREAHRSFLSLFLEFQPIGDSSQRITLRTFEARYGQLMFHVIQMQTKLVSRIRGYSSHTQPLRGTIRIVPHLGLVHWRLKFSCLEPRKNRYLYYDYYLCPFQRDYSTLRIKPFQLYNQSQYVECTKSENQWESLPWALAFTPDLIPPEGQEWIQYQRQVVKFVLNMKRNMLTVFPTDNRASISYWLECSPVSDQDLPKYPMVLKMPGESVDHVFARALEMANRETAKYNSTSNIWWKAPNEFVLPYVCEITEFLDLRPDPCHTKLTKAMKAMDIELDPLPPSSSD